MMFGLSTRTQALKTEAAIFAQQVLSPKRQQREREHLIEPEVIAALGERRWLGVRIREKWGGLGASVVDYATVLREIAKGDPSVAVTMAVTNMVSEVIQQFGTDTQCAGFIPDLVSGKVMGGAFALSEPSAGSDPAGMRTKAEKTSSGWRINGQKMWITTGDEAGVHIVWAKTGQGHKGISCFLVAKDTPGLKPGKPEEKMGLRASHTVALNLDDVEVGEDALLGNLGDGFKIAMVALDGGRIGIGSQSLGIAHAALEGLQDWYAESGRDAVKGQAFQAALADAHTGLEAAWLLTMRAASLKEQGKPFSRQAAMAKVKASEMANEVVRCASSWMGPDGVATDSVVSRMLRDARVTQIYEGTSEVQRIVIGRSVIQQGV